MATKMKLTNSAVLLILILLNFSCTKPVNTCPKMGYEYVYFKPGVTYSPGVDSFALGSQIILEASAPKTFFEEEKRYSVTLNESQILGPFAAQKATGNATTPRIGAIDDLDLIPQQGTLVKDTVQFSEGQLKGFRTVYWISDQDSFRLKVVIKPKIRGVFFISLSQQGNRDTDCALYKYFLKVMNTDQHLYFLEQVNNGYIPDKDRDHAYCFKVY
jgi:hypothetical protein